jgi:hypothetical protein
MMMPVAQEHASFTAIGSSRGYEPIDKIIAILIVDQTV